METGKARRTINSFYDRISWADQCTEATFDSRLICVAPCCVYLPIRWQDFTESVEVVARASAVYGLQPALLITGDAPRKMVEEIWWRSHKNTPPIHVVWVEWEQELWATRLTTSALDGINWQKSFEEGKAIY